MTPSALPSTLLAEILPVVGEISAVLDREDLVRVIAVQVRRLVDTRMVNLFLPDEDGHLRPAAEDGVRRPPGFRLAVGEGIVGAAAQSRQTVFVPDVTRDPRYVPGAEGVGAEIALPLVHRDRLVGVLNVEAPEAAALSVEVRTALEVLVSHLAVALENSRLYDETRRDARHREMLHEVGREIAAILDLDVLLERVAQIVKRVIDYEMFGILLLDETRGELVLRKSVRFCQAAQKSRIPLGKGLSGAAAASREPVLVDDVRLDPRYLNLIPETRSELVVPLIHQDRVIGVLDLESTEVGRFSEADAEILTAIASQVAVAVENARLYQELRRREQRRDREMAIARRVQHGLFPEETPRGPGWEASAHFLPAREVGGDLYDFYEIGEGLLGLSVGDVSGKGVPAALYGAFASGTVRARAFQRLEPAEVLWRMNRSLRRRGVEGMYCTLVFALFDFAAGRLRLANSGLPYPLHCRADGTVRQLEVGGLPLGAFDEATYSELALDVTPGDTFVFATDGVTEAWNGSEEYGVERLLARVGELGSQPAGELGAAILEDVRRFTDGTPGDDLTLVVVKVL